MASACPSQGAAICASVEVRPTEGGFEVVREGHRRGPLFAEREAAILHGEGEAPEVLVMSATGKVELTVRSRGILDALVDEYHSMRADHVREGRIEYWLISSRYAFGAHLGWFVEHEGHFYDGLGESGEDGPHPSREAAERCMAGHLRVAIAEARGRSA